MVKNTLYCFLILILISGCEKVPKCELVWSEEFNYEGPPNSSIWNFDIKGNDWGWGNNELQWYTDSSEQNAFVNQGTLKIVAKKDSVGGKGYTSARLNTHHKVSFNYGRLEIRAKLPQGRGIWPAIWMLGNNIDTIGWPKCGEIDIMEYVGYEPDSIYATIHSESYNHLKNTEKMKSLFIDNPQDFNIYAIEWSKDKIDFYCNDILYNTIINENMSENEWPFDKGFYLLLNVAVGGNWGGKYGVDPSIFPAIMEVDYVRLYK